MNRVLKRRIAEIMKGSAKNVGAQLLTAYAENEGKNAHHSADGLPPIDDSRYTTAKIIQLQKPALQI